MRPLTCIAGPLCMWMQVFPKNTSVCVKLTHCCVTVHAC